MFSAAVSIGSRLKNWKMKPMWSRRSWVSAVSSRSPISWPATVTEPEVGLSRPARMCISVDLPEPGRPHHGRQAAAGDVDGHVAQGMDGGVAVAVAADQVAGRDDGLGGAMRVGISSAVMVGSLWFQGFWGGKGYSYATASSTFRREARRAGRIAAAMPARAAKTVKPARMGTGIVSWA